MKKHEDRYMAVIGKYTLIGNIRASLFPPTSVFLLITVNCFFSYLLFAVPQTKI